MREYGQIQSAFWTHPDIQGLSIQAKVVGAYLLTSQHTNGIGCFRVPVGYISIDLNIDTETVLNGISELAGNGILVHDSTSEYILIPAFLRWNVIPNPNAAKARVKEFEVIPSSISIYPNLIKALVDCGKYWSEGFSENLETLLKRYPNPIDTVSDGIRDNKPDQTRPNQTKNKKRKLRLKNSQMMTSGAPTTSFP